MPFLKAENAEIYYEIYGNGKPVLFLGGLLGNCSMFNKYVFPYMTSDYTCISLNYRGKDTTKLFDSFDFSDLVSDILLLLRELGINKINIVSDALANTISAAFAATEAQIDQYWEQYSIMTSKMTNELSLVRSSSDFESAKTKIQNVMKEFGTSIASLNITESDASLVKSRYMYHVQYRTTLGIKLSTANSRFYIEYSRIKQLSGGDAFITGMFPTPNPQATNQ
jgi:hypothetical protein